MIAYCKVALPIYALFTILERLYNFYRFGSWTQTYLPIFVREQRLQDPTLPANFPWSTPFHEGVLGALFKPEKSIFLFDPLLALALIADGLVMEALGHRGPRLCGDIASAAGRVHQLLRTVHVLGGRLRLGRSLRFNRGRDGSPAVRSSTPSLSRESERLGMARRPRADCRQPRHTNRFPCLLAAAGDLSDGDTRASDVRDCFALQEHCRLRAREDGCLGIEHRSDGPGPLGLRPHHMLEFSAVPVAAGGSVAAVGGGCGVCDLGHGHCGSRTGAGATEAGDAE